MSLEKLGWNDFFERNFIQYSIKGFKPGRIATENNNFFRLVTPEGELMARGAGRLFYHASGKADLPAVGDWVAYRQPATDDELASVRHILPRKSLFTRKAVGRRITDQPVAANIDTVFIVNGLDDDFSPRRTERYLAVTWESGATPVVLLNKSDIKEDNTARIRQMEQVVIGVPVITISALEKEGLDELKKFLQPGKTVALLGSSGVGKSTLLNALLGEEIQKTGELTDYGKGQHVTRLRELFILPSGAMLIDTPGMRELQLWDVEDGIADTFSEIEEAAANCRFSDCRHRSEPECAVRKAVESGDILQDRYDSYLKLQDELKALAARQDHKEMLEKKSEAKKLQKEIRRFYTVSDKRRSGS